ncbi:MAG TPA: hypothetical protein VN636_11610 [Acidimicrobiia bacterium]|nr:hypothetical protein [Acidimicrobiia bacterium]
MTTTSTTSTAAPRDVPTAPSPDFAAELSRLKIKGRDTEPERALVFVGIVLFVIGVVLIVFALQSAHTTADPLVQNERIILAIFGALIGLSGVVVWARYSLTRYFRYWLLRVIFEERLQQDRTIEVLERIERKLDRPQA